MNAKVDNVLRAHGVEPNNLGWLDRWAARRLVRRYTIALHRKDRMFLQSERAMAATYNGQYYQGRYNEHFHPGIRTYPHSTDESGHRTVLDFGQPTHHICVHCGEVDPDSEPCPNRGQSWSPEMRPDPIYWLEDKT